VTEKEEPRKRGKRSGGLAWLKSFRKREVGKTARVRGGKTGPGIHTSGGLSVTKIGRIRMREWVKGGKVPWLP